MGEILHEVDFNQLKIENKQYIEKIDERNQDLLRLKLMAGNTLQVLNTYKVSMHDHLEVVNPNLQSGHHFIHTSSVTLPATGLPPTLKVLCLKIPVSGGRTAFQHYKLTKTLHPTLIE